MKHPIGSVAALKRTLTPGTRIKLVNHLRPQASRVTLVHPKTNTVDLVTEAEGAPRGSHLSWPKRADLRPDESDPATVHIDSEGIAFLTLTVLADNDATPLGPLAAKAPRVDIEPHAGLDKRQRRRARRRAARAAA